jgi:hypothetical protein
MRACGVHDMHACMRSLRTERERGRIPTTTTHASLCYPPPTLLPACLPACLPVCLPVCLPHRPNLALLVLEKAYLQAASRRGLTLVYKHKEKGEEPPPPGEKTSKQASK